MCCGVYVCLPPQNDDIRALGKKQFGDSFVKAGMHSSILIQCVLTVIKCLPVGNKVNLINELMGRRYRSSVPPVINAVCTSI